MFEIKKGGHRGDIQEIYLGLARLLRPLGTQFLFE
jgi:hypothetical protein